MIETQGLSWYIPNRKEIAHLARAFSETGKIYIFCNRTFITGSGRMLDSKDYDPIVHGNIPMCDKCFSALEATLERVSILQGIPPPQRYKDWVKDNPES